MAKIRLAGISAIALVIVSAAFARAEDITAKKLLIQEHAQPAKRQIQVQSNDVNVALSEAGNPGANGAAIHVYSASDDFCAILPAGADWKSTNTQWKYKSKVTKNSAQIKNGKLIVKIKSGVTFTLADDAPQDIVNVQVQFGTGTRYCMRCSGNKKDDVKKFQAKDCAVAACDAEPSSCDSVGPTTTSTTATTTTSTGPSTTSTTNPPGLVLKGALTPSTGRFNYNLVLGVPGANSACNSNFPGTHACTYAELQSAEAAGDLDGLKDTANDTVTSFWAIDPTHIDDLQCTVTVAWDYQTAHTGQFGEMVELDNGTGTLGPLLSGIPDGVTCTGSNWVGCCD
jgi:hypothetical protein